jgi:hypothetical protein
VRSENNETESIPILHVEKRATLVLPFILCLEPVGKTDSQQHKTESGPRISIHTSVPGANLTV